MSADKSGLRYAALALSFANIVYLRVWFDLVAAPANGGYGIKHFAGSREFGAVSFNVMVLAAITWCALRFAPRPLTRVTGFLAKLLILVGVLLCLNALRAVGAIYTPVLRSGAFRLISPRTLAVVAGVIALAGIFVLFRYFEATATVLRAALWACLPMAPMTFVTGAVRTISQPTSKPEPALAKRLTPQPRPHVRVVWAIFDEWDYRLSFDERPRGVLLPVLDSLAGRSLMGTHVLGPQGRIPVSSMATQVAIPSLLAGEPRNIDGFENNVFARAHALGWNVAIGGWYVPYCRLFAQDAFQCYWDQMYLQSTAAAPSFAEALRIQNRSLFETQLFSIFGQSLTSERHAAEYQAILNFALAAEADSDAGLVFLHFNIPHAPHFYDAQSGRLDAPERGLARAYGEALMLVDRTVGRLERELGPDTVLILSADHPLRAADQIDGKTDQRVPFLVHFPGQTEELREDGEFSSLKTASLVLEILDGEVRTPAEADHALTDKPW